MTTKLEELKAVFEAACDACEAAFVECGWYVIDVAWRDYQEELKKIQEENSDD